MVKRFPTPYRPFPCVSACHGSRKEEDEEKNTQLVEQEVPSFFIVDDFRVPFPSLCVSIRTNLKFLLFYCLLHKYMHTHNITNGITVSILKLFLARANRKYLCVVIIVVLNCFSLISQIKRRTLRSLAGCIVL